MDIDLTKPETFDSGIRFPKLALKKDETARINIMSTKGISVSLTHWIDKIGYVHCHAKAEDFGKLREIERNGGDPDSCLMCRMAQENGAVVKLPASRFAAKVLRYRTDPAGNLMSSGLQYWFEIWLLSPKKFFTIIQMQKEWKNLSQHDITLTCTETQYYSMDIEIKRDAWWTKEKEAVIKYWKEEAGKYNLMECLGANLDDDVLKRRFAVISRRVMKASEPVSFDDGVVPSSGKPASTPEDFNTLLDEVDKPVEETNSEEPKSKIEKEVDLFDDILGESV